MSRVRSHVLTLSLLSLALFLMGNSLINITDPVESNYALTATEMLAAGDWVSPRIYGHFWYDKPAMFYWELMASVSVFGNNEFAMRFPSALFGLLGVLMTYWFARRLYDAKTALLAALMQATAFGYWLVSKTVITDMTLFVFFNAVLVCFFNGCSGQNKNWYYGCYLFAGLATLTKGPIGVLLPGFVATVFICWRRNWREIPRMKPLGFLLLAAVVALWYVPMYNLHGRAFLDGFLGVHNVLRATQSEHPMWDVWWYYSVLVFLVFFPWSFVAIPRALVRFVRERGWRWLACDDRKLFLLLWAVLVTWFYQCMATKYSTYTLPTLMPIAILAARGLCDRERLVLRAAAAWAVCLVLLTYFVAVPTCRDKGYSGYHEAQTLAANAQPGDLVCNYGDYMTSVPYYSGLTVHELATADKIEALKPGGISWNAKNVMPFWDIDALPADRDVYVVVRRKFHERFLNDVHLYDLEWQELSRCRCGSVFRKPRSVNAPRP